jgi:hypothetical protein
VQELPPTIADPSDPPNSALRLQILSVEHWNLLSTRSMTYNEMYSRTSIFLTVVSAAVVALALVAQATDFGDGFYAFSLLVLPVVLFLGVGTYVRLDDANYENVWLVFGMNRLRHAYLELAPELEPYFVMGHHDDEHGLMQSTGPDARLRVSRILGGTPLLVGVVTCVLAGVLLGLIAKTSGAPSALSIALGGSVSALLILGLTVSARRRIERLRAAWVPRFPDAVGRE